MIFMTSPVTRFNSGVNSPSRRVTGKSYNLQGFSTRSAASSTVFHPAFHPFSSSAKHLNDHSNLPFNVQHAARDFYKSTLDMSFGTNIDEVKRIFLEVHNNKAHAEFDQAVATLGKRDGYNINSAMEVLDRKFSGVLKPFMQVPRKECMDILLHGKNLYRPTAMEYRLRGVWTAVSDFLTVCKKNPVLSGLVIGSVAYFGGTYPFLGAVSGLIIMAWAGTVSLMNELKARKMPVMDEKKAECYLQSGENIMAFLLTFSGVDGILAGAKNGLSTFAGTTSKMKGVNPLTRFFLGAWNATKSKLQHGAEVGIRFVVGLFDNVLLPFNALSEKMNKSTTTH